MDSGENDPAPLGPTARFVDADRRLRAAQDLLDHLENEIPKLRSATAQMPRHFAAMGLARSVRLLRGINFLRAGSYGDMGQVVARSLIETFALSMFVLYGGDEAYDRVRGAHVRNVGLQPALDPMMEEVQRRHEAWGGPKDKIIWEQLIKRDLPALLEDHEGPQALTFFQLLYDQSYRGLSEAGVHAGAVTIGLHNVKYRDLVGVALAPYKPDDGTAQVIFSSALVGMLATRVLAAYGRSTARVQALLREAAYDMDANDLIIEPPPG